jgi:hypothetical protein
MTNISDKLCRKYKSLILFPIFFFKNPAFFFCENLKNYGRGRQAAEDKIIRRMRYGCWINKATNTLGISNSYYSSTAKMDMRTRLIVAL